MLSFGDWIALGGLIMSVQAVVVGCAVYVVRAAPKAINAHEHDCSNYEPNTSVKIQAIRDQA